MFETVRMSSVFEGTECLTNRSSKTTYCMTKSSIQAGRKRELRLNPTGSKRRTREFLRTGKITKQLFN